MSARGTTLLTLIANGSALGQSATTGRRLDELAGALEQERRVIDDLGQALLRQRAGVVADDAEAIEASGQAVSRTLLTIDDARRRRIELVGSLTGTDEMPLAHLEHCLRRTLPERLGTARESLRGAAEAAARDIAINQQVVRRALEAGDAFLQQLFASVGDPPVYAPPVRGGDARASGVPLNRDT